MIFMVVMCVGVGFYFGECVIVKFFFVGVDEGCYFVKYVIILLVFVKNVMDMWLSICLG